MEKIYALVLAAGNGTRMGGNIAKQYQILGNRPVICHTLAAFEKSVADEVILVVSAGMEEYVKTRIVGKYGFCKVRKIVVGGKERCDSVYAGMRYIRERLKQEGRREANVLVHDGARPFVTPKLIAKMAHMAEKEVCAIPALPVKDTIKRGKSGFVQETPDRSTLYAVQTPQVFRFSVLWAAFEAYRKLQKETPGEMIQITDDAMLVERMLGKQAALAEGDYRNIKLTTPEDMLIARAFLSEKAKNRFKKLGKRQNVLSGKNRKEWKFHRRIEPGK